MLGSSLPWMKNVHFRVQRPPSTTSPFPAPPPSFPEPDISEYELGPVDSSALGKICPSALGGDLHCLFKSHYSRARPGSA